MKKSKRVNPETSDEMPPYICVFPVCSFFFMLTDKYYLPTSFILIKLGLIRVCSWSYSWIKLSPRHDKTKKSPSLWNDCRTAVLKTNCPACRAVDRQLHLTANHTQVKPRADREQACWQFTNTICIKITILLLLSNRNLVSRLPAFNRCFCGLHETKDIYINFCKLLQNAHSY